jgi:hypothetical protein
MLIFLAGKFFSNFFLSFFIVDNGKAICFHRAAAQERQ